MIKTVNDIPILYLPTSYNGFDKQDYFSELISGRGNKPVPTDYHCCICGKPFHGYGNNPAPLTYDVRLRCCDACNDGYIIPIRFLGQNNN